MSADTALSPIKSSASDRKTSTPKAKASAQAEPKKRLRRPPRRKTERELNALETLGGLPANATKDEIAAAYRKLAMKHHPDKGGEDEMFKHIINAYEVLKPSRKQNSKINAYEVLKPSPKQKFEKKENVTQTNMCVQESTGFLRPRDGFFAAAQAAAARGGAMVAAEVPHLKEPRRGLCRNTFSNFVARLGISFRLPRIPSQLPTQARIRVNCECGAR